MRTEIIRNFVPIIGGKSNMLEHLLGRIQPHTCFVEVFGGGGVVVLNKSPSNSDIYNDVNDDLVNLFEVVREYPAELMHLLEATPYARAVFDEFKEQRKVETDIIRRAFIYFYLIKTSVNSKCQTFSTTTGDARNARLSSYWNSIRAMARVSRRLRTLVITKLDFIDCIKRFDSDTTFFYVDPPYYKVYCYEHNLTIERHIELAALLKNIKGKFLVSINDDPAVRQMYSWAKIEELVFKYSTQVERDTNPKVTELMISNYNVPLGLFDDVAPPPEEVDIEIVEDVKDIDD